jgi:hypothetical protein
MFLSFQSLHILHLWEACGSDLLMIHKVLLWAFMLISIFIGISLVYASAAPLDDWIIITNAAFLVSNIFLLYMIL